MYSKFFSGMGRFESPQLGKVVSVFTCDQELFKKIVDWVDSQEEFPRLNSAVSSHLVQVTAVEDPDLIREVLQGMLWLLSSFAQSDDTYENYYADFKAVHAADLEGAEYIDGRIEHMRPLTEKYVLYVAKLFSQRRGGPVLAGSEFSVALKPVIVKTFDHERGRIDEYQPEVTGFVPVLMAEIENSNGDSISFQMTHKELDKLINNLLALKIELSKAIN